MLLFTPGPTPVPEKIRKSMSDETIHHRTPEFEAIFAKTRQLLFKLIGSDEIVLLASSGTGAMESAVTNLTSSKLLSVNSGKFGERFRNIAEAHKIPVKELKYEWNTPTSIEDIMREIENDSSIDAVAIQISESSGGLRHPVEEIAKAVKNKNPNIIIIADAITAMGVEKIDISNIDAIIGGSQKAFMLPPGLAILGLSNRAIEKIGKGKGFYFNLYSEIKKQRTNTTAYTATTTLIIGLLAMLEEFDQIGFDEVYQRTAIRSKAVISALSGIGLTIYPKVPSLAMTTIYHDKAPAIKKMLAKEFNVSVASGQDEMKDVMFRINNMGLIENHEISWAVNSVEVVLDKMGIRKFDGTANKIFTEKILNLI